MCVLSLRPAVRALPSRQMFEHMLKRHNVLFVYVGGESPLKVSATYRLFSRQCHRRRLLLLLNVLKLSVKKTHCLCLQEKYNDVASELIVYTYFFSASEEVFPEVTRLFVCFSLFRGFLCLFVWLSPKSIFQPIPLTIALAWMIGRTQHNQLGLYYEAAAHWLL